MITYHKGNVIDAWLADNNAVLIHGCNCFHAMNSGIAKEIRERFPEAYKADCESIKGSIFKLGSSTIWKRTSNQSLVNAYTQFEPGANFEYAALRKSLCEWDDVCSNGETVYLPRIGAGIGGGNWYYIEKIISSMLEDYTVKIYTLE